jgi:hypothetical protein
MKPLRSFLYYKTWSIDGNPALHRETYQETKSRMVLLVTKQVCGIGGALVKDKTFIISILNILLKDNLLNVPQLGITETVRGTTFNYFSSKIDQIWNTNFNSSLRANVGKLMLKVADLMAVPL